MTTKDTLHEVKTGRDSQMAKVLKAVDDLADRLQPYVDYIVKCDEYIAVEGEADTTIQNYVEMRDALSTLEASFGKLIKPFKEAQEQKEHELHSKMDAVGVTSFKGPHGTCFFQRAESVTVEDREAFIQYVKDNDAFYLLENRVAKTPALEIMGEDRDKALPPGLKYAAIRKVNVRRK